MKISSGSLDFKYPSLLAIYGKKKIHRNFVRNNFIIFKIKNLIFFEMHNPTPIYESKFQITIKILYLLRRTNTNFIPFVFLGFIWFDNRSGRPSRSNMAIIRTIHGGWCQILPWTSFGQRINIFFATLK